MDTKNVMMSALLLLVISLVPFVNGGSSCTFKSAPNVEQVAIDKVKVSWSDVVADFGCLDLFIINYWEEGKSKVDDGKLVGPLDANQFSTEIKNVTPSQSYQLQLKTIKNGYYGRSYGQSEIVEFKTDRDYDTDDTDGDGVVNAVDLDDDNDGIPDKEDTDDDNDGILDVDEKTDTMAIAIKNYIIAICGVIGGLIVIGIIYKLVCKCACNKKSSADPEKMYSLVENNDTLLNGSVHKDLLTAE